MGYFSLHTRTVRSGGWAFLQRGIERFFNFVRTVVLARLLSPNDFGIFGICCLAISTLKTFTESGFNVALIQKKTDIEPYLNTAWSVNLLRGVFWACILFWSSSIVSNFFNAPEAISVLRVLAILQFINSIQNIGIVCFQKELQFYKIFLLHLTVGIIGLVTGITMAYLLRNVWALVYASVATSLAGLIFSYLLHPFRPRFFLDLKKAKELFNFGKWIWVSNILVFLMMQGDDIFVGKFLGSVYLGFYQMAYRISNLPATELTHTISKVTLPAYSKLQDDLFKLKEGFLKVLKIITFFSFLFAGLIFTFAPEFTKIFLGKKWMFIVPSMQILVWWGVIRAMVGSMSSVFVAIGKPDIVTKCQLVQVIFMFLLLYPLTKKWNIAGTSLAVLISAFVMLVIRTYIFMNEVKLCWGKIYQTVMFPFISSAVSILVSLSLKEKIIISNSILHLFTLTGIFLVTFIFLIILAEKFAGYNITGLLKESIKLLKTK
ncbi:MAG TPA: lipopolysaccharide biosynthesis protein [Firmicutes bacterium]|nr:lipopolysaccharide biosynthesis protein [Bacillota bacterium]